jgi:hypothetical protein
MDRQDQLPAIQSGGDMVKRPLAQGCIYGLKYVIQDKEFSISFLRALNVHLNQDEERQEVELGLAQDFRGGKRSAAPPDQFDRQRIVAKTHANV